MEEALVTELRRLNFSEKEAKVYIAAMKLGTSTMQKIAKYFTVEDPSKIQAVLEKERLELAEKEKTVNNVMPKLSEMFEITHGGENKPQVRFYEGKEGLLAVRDELLKAKSKELFSLYHIDHLKGIFSDEERQEFSKKRINKKIKAHAIYSSKVIITSLKAPYLSVMIESNDIAQSFTQILKIVERTPGASDAKKK